MPIAYSSLSLCHNPYLMACSACCVSSSASMEGGLEGRKEERERVWRKSLVVCSKEAITDKLAPTLKEQNNIPTNQPDERVNYFRH